MFAEASHVYRSRVVYEESARSGAEGLVMGGVAVTSTTSVSRLAPAYTRHAMLIQNPSVNHVNPEI